MPLRPRLRLPVLPVVWTPFPWQRGSPPWLDERGLGDPAGKGKTAVQIPVENKPQRSSIRQSVGENCSVSSLHLRTLILDSWTENQRRFATPWIKVARVKLEHGFRKYRSCSVAYPCISVTSQSNGILQSSVNWLGLKTRKIIKEGIKLGTSMCEEKARPWKNSFEISVNHKELGFHEANYL